MTKADHWEPQSADQHFRLRNMLQASVTFQIELWTLRDDLGILFGLGDDDEFDNLLDSVISDFAAGVPEEQHALQEHELDRLVMYVESAADDCRYRL